MKYTIPTYYLPKVTKKLDRMNKSVSKAKINPISYTVSTPYTITQHIEEHKKREVEVVDLTTDRDPLVNNGWVFLALIEHDPAGNMILKANTDFCVPETYRKTSSYVCEHCKTKHDRKYTYLIRKEGLDEVKQVGSTCIKAFLGFDITGALKYRDLFESLERDVWDNDLYTGMIREVHTVPVENFLPYVLGESELHGYVSAKIAYETGQLATGKAAWDLMIDMRPSEAQARDLRAIHTKIDEYKAYTEKILSYVKSLSPKNEFEANLVTLVTRGYVTFKTANIAAAAVIMYKKHMDSLKEKAKPSDWIGNPGEKIEVRLTVKSVNYIENRYSRGSIQICNMRDENGNIFSWFNSGRTSLVEGVTYTGKATVKRHNEYKGHKVTVLTRFKPVELTAEDAPGREKNVPSNGGIKIFNFKRS